MASSRTTLLVLGASAASAAVVGAVGVLAYRAGRASVSASEPPAPRAPNPSPPRQTATPEPQEGYEERWLLYRDRAFATCRQSPEVQTQPQAVACALGVAYPEAAPWTEPAVWAPWMQGAAELVAAELTMAASLDGAHPRAWEFRVWLRGDRELSACMASGQRFPAALALCAAQRLYPTVDWTGIHRFPWQNELLDVLTRRAQGVA